MMNEEQLKKLSPSVFAFVGDAVYGLFVRTALADTNRSSGDLHALSVQLVNASAQSKAFHQIETYLTEEELDLFKRGRNFHTKSTPKNATVADYHTATGLECLFGYLYLSGQADRAKKLFDQISFQNLVHH